MQKREEENLRSPHPESANFDFGYNDQNSLNNLLSDLFSYVEKSNSDITKERTPEELKEYEGKLLSVYGMGFFNNAYLESSTNPECLALENEMAEMGVRVTFSDNLEDGKLITEVFKDLYSKGYNLPKEVILVDFNYERNLGMTPNCPDEMHDYIPIFYSKGIADADRTKANGSQFREYVAEVFAGIMSGKEYSKFAMDLYYKLGRAKMV